MWNPELKVLSQYGTALNDPRVLFYFSPISYVRTHDTNEWNTYTNNPDPTNNNQRHSSIMHWCVPILESGSTFLVYHCGFNQTFNAFFQSKADKICVAILQVQIQVCMQHRCFLLDFRCFLFWRTNFSCFNCCFWFNGSLYDSCLW